MDKNLLKILDNISKDNEQPTFKKHDRVLIIDGMNLFLRNFATMNIINEKGVHIGGLSGFLRSLGFLINHINPTSAYIVFDGVGSSINRKNLLPGYKSNRNTGKLINGKSFGNIDDEGDAKINQIVRLIQYLKCIPVKTISLDKVEADDIIAHLSKQLSTQKNSKVYIVSSDKDFLQLVDHNITLFRPTEKEFFTPEKIKDKIGLPVENFILYKTLLGDNSDKIPGIKGLGEKGIFKKFPELQTQILTLDDIFDICAAKYKEHLIYSRIIFEKNNVLKNYKLMDLSNPLVDDDEKEIIEELITTSAPILNADVFLRLYNEDGLKHLFKDVSWWLRDTFKVLNSFNK
jgi:DNA polymerase-1